jgi:hypothetical protein
MKFFMAEHGFIVPPDSMRLSQPDSLGLLEAGSGETRESHIPINLAELVMPKANTETNEVELTLDKSKTMKTAWKLYRSFDQANRKQEIATFIEESKGLTDERAIKAAEYLGRWVEGMHNYESARDEAVARITEAQALGEDQAKEVFSKWGLVMPEGKLPQLTRKMIDKITAEPAPMTDEEEGRKEGLLARLGERAKTLRANTIGKLAKSGDENPEATVELVEQADKNVRPMDRLGFRQKLALRAFSVVALGYILTSSVAPVIGESPLKQGSFASEQTLSSLIVDRQEDDGDGPDFMPVPDGGGGPDPEATKDLAQSGAVAEARTESQAPVAVEEEAPAPAVQEENPARDEVDEAQKETESQPLTESAEPEPSPTPTRNAIENVMNKVGANFSIDIPGFFSNAPMEFVGVEKFADIFQSGLLPTPEPDTTTFLQFPQFNLGGESENLGKNILGMLSGHNGLHFWNNLTPEQQADYKFMAADQLTPGTEITINTPDGNFLVEIADTSDIDGWEKLSPDRINIQQEVITPASSKIAEYGEDAQGILFQSCVSVDSPNIDNSKVGRAMALGIVKEFTPADQQPVVQAQVVVPEMPGWQGVLGGEFEE